MNCPEKLLEPTIFFNLYTIHVINEMFELPIKIWKMYMQLNYSYN